MTNGRYRQGKGVKWVLSIIALLGVAMLVIPFLLTPPAYLYLQVTDTIFNDSNFDGRSGEISRSDSGISHSFKIHKFGKDYIARVGRISSGKTNWQVRVEGYHPADLSVEIPPMKRKTAAISLKPAFGRLKIRGKNAVKPEEPIEAKMKVKFASDGKEIEGDPNSGILVSHLSPGTHTINTDTLGFYLYEKEDVKVSEGETTEVEIPLIPRLTQNEAARIVLTWDKDPKDLDSHLFLPKNNELNTQHIYYPAKHMKASVGNTLAVVLDVDDTDSYGPETITIYNTINGLYKYGIYHFSGSGSIGSTSKAEIKLFTHNDEIQKFSAPNDCEKKWWYVFDLRINGIEVQILPKNGCLTPEQMGWQVGKKESSVNE